MKIIKKISFLMLAASFLFPILTNVIYANEYQDIEKFTWIQAFTYQGWSIHNLRTARDFTTTRSSNGIVHHTQSRSHATVPTSASLDVQVRRQTTFGSTIIASRRFTGNSSGEVHFSTTGGTYFVNFVSGNSSHIFDISGRFSIWAR